MFSWGTDRCRAPRVVAKKNFASGRKNLRRQVGIGIAIETLIESTVRVTIRQSDNEPIASVAATASFNRDEATGAQRPLKPTAPGDRIMAGILKMRGRITPRHWDYSWNRWQYCGGTRLENGEMAAAPAVMPAIPRVFRAK